MPNLVTNFNEEAINKQFEIAGWNATFHDHGNYAEYTITAQQKQKFAKWFIKTVTKRFKVSQGEALLQYSTWIILYGLNDC